MKNFAVERELHFVNDIEPILTKTGCNTGGCHGKASGQNGFKLSLFAFEPKFDYDALVNEAHGRRVFPGLARGIAAAEKGHRRDRCMAAARVSTSTPKLQDALPLDRAGRARTATRTRRRCDRIEVLPRERLLAGVGEQQLRVVAHYTDGSTQDVTRQAEYKAQQPDILKVETNGLVSTLGHTGEGAVMVRYMGQVDVARVAVPFSRGLPAEAYAHFQPKNFVDELVAAKWHKLGIAPSAHLHR